jgi:hypothetical protein
MEPQNEHHLPSHKELILLQFKNHEIHFRLLVYLGLIALPLSASGQTMTSIIDPAFSVFNLIERIQQSSILLNHRRTMSVISHEIENTTIEDGAKSRVFAGFQYLSRFLPQQKRYERLASRAESVYVFGVPDVEPPAIPNVKYIHITPNHRLSREWFLIAYGAEYATALATEEITKITDPDEKRMFKGIWTFDVSLVVILHDWLASLVDAKPQKDFDQMRFYSRQIHFMTQNMSRWTSAIGKLRSDVIAGEIKTAMKAQPDENIAGQA